MKTVILCGGMGTRIRDVADNIPKPMVPIGGQPVLWHVMKLYGHQGFNDFILCLGYKSEVIRDYFLGYHTRQHDLTVDLTHPGRVEFHGDTQAENWRVTLANTGLSTMTGSRVAKIRKYLGNDREFFLTYADGVAPVDLGALLEFHRKSGKLATVTGVKPESRFGEMQIDGGSVRSFAEKPPVTAGRVNGGFFVVQREFIERYLLDDSDRLILEKDALPACARDGQLACFNHDDFWQCMDTFREYQMLNELWDADRAPWKMWA